MILTVAFANGPVSYSRNKNHYLMPRRYRSRLYTYSKVVRASDQLAGDDLILHDKAPVGRRGVQSTMLARPELVEAVKRILEDGSPLRPRAPAEAIILRNAEKVPIDYRDNASTRRMRRNLQTINDQLRQAEIGGVMPCTLVRIFNRSFGRGGRFYCIGGGWQSMGKDLRKRIQINGEPVVEIDYKTLHPAIIYSQCGAPLPEDCYAIGDWPRDLVKVAMLILINAKDVASARSAIATEGKMAPVANPGSKEAYKAANQLICDIKRAHSRITDAFHSDKGAELMRIDSTLAETVMLFMQRAGIVVLPVHDSFLVQESEADRLEGTMLRVAYEAGYEALRVSR